MKNLYDIAKRALQVSVNELIKQNQTADVSRPPSEVQLYNELAKCGFYVFSSTINVVVLEGPMGMTSNLFRCGDVAFILMVNWDKNPDGMNREEILTPLGVIYDNRSVVPFTSLSDFSDPKYISSVLLDSVDALLNEYAN